MATIIQSPLRACTPSVFVERFVDDNGNGVFYFLCLGEFERVAISKRLFDAFAAEFADTDCRKLSKPE